LIYSFGSHTGVHIEVIEFQVVGELDGDVFFKYFG
jgi:hypothetical protein